MDKFHNLKTLTIGMYKDNLSKIATSISYNPKIFNNRISLQSRKDLDLLSKYKIPSQDLMLNKIP